MTTVIRLDQNDVPGWLSETASAGAPSGEAERISKLPDAIDDDAVASEMEVIERRAAEGKAYHYSSKWPSDAVAKLREYAHVCGIGDKFAAVEPARDDADPQAVPDDPMSRKAAEILAARKDAPAGSLSETVGDPFHLADKAEAAQDDVPVMPRVGAVASIVGEYDYLKSPAPHVKRGENSIAEPDAIGAMSADEDTGERLRKENRNLAAQRRAEKSAWQKEAVQAAKDAGAGSLPRGSVFMTEACNAQPGLRDGAVQQGVFQEKAAEMPDRTGGEMLKEKNRLRRVAIQRVKDGAGDWQKVAGTTKAEISDPFAEELEKRLEGLGLKQ